MLTKLKLMLGIEAENTDRDELLELIISQTETRLKSLVGGLDISGKLDHIILEIAIVRFNRIGSEGLTSHSVEGESLSFAENDFDAFSEDIQVFLNSQNETKVGKVRFI